MEATGNLQQGELIGNTPMWRISLEVLSLTHVSGFTISSSSYVKDFETILPLCNMFLKSKIQQVELLERVDKYIDIKEFLKMKDSGFADNESSRAKRKHEDSEKGTGKKPK